MYSICIQNGKTIIIIIMKNTGRPSKQKCRIAIGRFKYFIDGIYGMNSRKSISGDFISLFSLSLSLFVFLDCFSQNIYKRILNSIWFALYSLVAVAVPIEHNSAFLRYTNVVKNQKSIATSYKKTSITAK